MHYAIKNCTIFTWDIYEENLHGQRYIYMLGNLIRAAVAALAETEKNNV